MKYAIIENGVVVNTAEADPSFAQEQGWVASEIADKNWKYADGVFTAPEVEDVEPQVATKEQLMAELAALTAKIQALE